MNKRAAFPAAEPDAAQAQTHAAAAPAVRGAEARPVPRPFAGTEGEGAPAPRPFAGTEGEGAPALCLPAGTEGEPALPARGGKRETAPGGRRGPLFRSAKDVAAVGVMTALLIAAQYALSPVAGVEIVTPLLLCFCCAFGPLRGAVAAIAFSLLRCLLNGFALNVVALYLVYFPLFAVAFGFLGRAAAGLSLARRTVAVTVCAVLFTACFTLLDDVLTPWILGFSARTAQVYFLASLPVLGVQCACAAVTVPLLYPPLSAALRAAAKL